MGMEAEYSFMSDEEMATMSAQSDKALAEIHHLCEPFFDHGFNFQAPPPEDLSAALVNGLGLGFMFEDVGGDVWPNPAQTMQARNVAHQTPLMTSGMRGTKRKACDDGSENFQHVQLDVERRERRPIKQVNSVHHASFRDNTGAIDFDAAYNPQQWQHITPQIGDYQSRYSH